METNLLKTITRSACRAIALCALAGAPILASCGIDELEGRIDQVENRLTELETSMQEQIDGVKGLVDGTTTVVSAEFDSEKKMWTVVLSNGKTINVSETAAGGPKIGIAEIDGKKVWTLNGTPLVNANGENLPVESVPDIRVNPETNEWEITSDNGKTWLSTGIQAADGMSIFSKVEEDDAYVYFILSDGTRLKVAKTLNSGVTMLSGKQYFNAGQTKTVKLELSNIEDVIVTDKPDGWRTSVDGDKLNITAPVAENTYAEESGMVSVLAKGVDGNPYISKIYVEIGEAPVSISIDVEGNVEFSVRADLAGNYWEFPGYAYGISPINEFSPEALAESLPGNDRRIESIDTESTTIADLLGKEPAKGDSYMVWAIPMVDNYDGTYSFPAEDFVYEAYTSTIIELGASGITFDNANLVVTPKGVESYYGGVLEFVDFKVADILADINGNTGMYETVNGIYDGPATDYAIGWSPNSLVPGTKYIAFAAPNYGYGNTISEDDIYTVEFELPALKAGGNAAVTIGDVTSELKSVKADCTPNENVYKFFAGYYSAADYQAIAPEDLAVTIYSAAGSKKGTTEPVTINRSGLEPDTKGWIVALAIDKDGNYNIAQKEANTAKLVFSDITITATATNISLDGATIELSGTSDIVKFRYRNFTAANWTTGFPFQGDETKTENNLATTEYYPNITVNATDGKASVNLERLPSGTEHKFFVIGIDKDGKPTRMVCVDYEPTFPEGKYIKASDAEWTDNRSQGPVLTNIKVDGLPVSGMTELPTTAGFHPLSADITVGEKCSKYWIYAGGEIAAIGAKKKTLHVINAYDTKVKNESGNKNDFMINEWASDLNNLQICIVWQDTDGKYYELESTPLADYLKKTE